VKITGDPLIIKAHDSHINAIKFSPDGRILLSAGMDNLVKLWSVPDWKHTGTLSGHEKSVNVLNLFSDGTRLLTTSSDRTIRIWDLKTRCELQQLDIVGSTALLSPDEETLAIIDNPWMKIVNLENTASVERIKPFPKRTIAIAFSTQPQYLAVGGQGDDIIIYDTLENSRVHTIERAHQGYVLSLSFSPDSKQLVSVGYEKRLCFWDQSTWNLLGELPLQNQGVQSLTFSPNGNYLAIASDHRITLVDAQSMEIKQNVDLKPKGVYCLAFSPDGKWLACGAADKRIRIWVIEP